MRAPYAVILVVLVGSVGCVAAGEFGLALMVGAPFALGVAVGRAFGFKLALKLVVGVTLFCGLLASLVFLNLGGMFCALLALGMGAAPLLPGVWVGHVLRKRKLERTALAVIFTAPLLLHVGDLAARGPHPVETVATIRVLPLDVAAAWGAMRFYEDVDGPRPLALRMGLPRPLRTVGVPRRVGAKTQCIYEGGYLVKRTTELVPERRLAFEVLEQVNVEDRSIRLRDGAFDLVPLTGETTEVTMTTRYVPLLAPRWYWRPLEAWVVHSLHEYVGDSMALQPRSPRPEPALDEGMDLARGVGVQQQVEVAVIEGETVGARDPGDLDVVPVEAERRGVAHPRGGEAVRGGGDHQDVEVAARSQRSDRRRLGDRAAAVEPRPALE